MRDFVIHSICFLALLVLVNCRLAKHLKLLEAIDPLTPDAIINEAKQLPLALGKETSPPNFVRLVILRLIYGIASTMGLEDRLEGVFNGVFVPPNAENDLFGINNIDYSDDDDEGLLGLFDGDN